MDATTPQSLQPLRIPAGWALHWNTLYASSRMADGDFGGSSTFYAVNASRRFAIDVAFRPEFDPAGAIYLTVSYQPWPRTDRGRRRTDLPFAFDADAETVHVEAFAPYAAMVDALEAWLAKCAGWTREGN